MQGSVNDVIARMESAKREFKRTLVELSGCSEDDAERVMRFYLAKKLAKIDIGIGRINVKNGALLDRDIILNAAKAA